MGSVTQRQPQIACGEPRVFALYPEFESALYASLGEEPVQRRFTREDARAEETV